MKLSSDTSTHYSFFCSAILTEKNISFTIRFNLIELPSLKGSHADKISKVTTSFQSFQNMLRSFIFQINFKIRLLLSSALTAFLIY